MFEFLFKYPASVFTRGTFVLLGAWPVWLFWLCALALAGVLGAFIWRKRASLGPTARRGRLAVIWLLQSLLLAVLLLLLWEPAVSVTALNPQQNIIAVVVDDSRSMALSDESPSREERAKTMLTESLIKGLQTRFQVRLYRLGSGVERVERLVDLRSDQPSTQIGKGLRQLADEAATTPIGAVVLLSDGADTAGGVDLATMNELRRRRLPINTIGLGKTEIANDVELAGLQIPARALTDSRLQADVTIVQKGFSGKRAGLVLSGGGAVLATRDVQLRGDLQQVEKLEFSAGRAGVKNIEVRLDPLPGEVNTQNNRLTRILSVEAARRRILYIEGEPRWEYKFLRRATDDDSALTVVSVLRTTQNKIYRQGISNPAELADGFPTKPEDLFAYQGLVLGSVESAFFTANQQQMVRDFVDRRGGGLLLLAGRSSLADGGYNAPPFAELLPVTLPARKNTFQRSFVAAELTDAGKQSLICRIEEDPEKSVQHWEVLPYLANFQDAGAPKPGALVLANVNSGGKRFPLLITENYGRGRTAVLATAGTWRWRMQQPVGDTSQETFWRQLLRWTVSATPEQVIASTPTPDLEDDGQVQLHAEVRDKTYLPAGDAEVDARVVGPDGSVDHVPLRPDSLNQGQYSAEWNAPKPGSYIVEVTARRANDQLGKDVVTIRREDGVAENFHRGQNRDLLQKLAEETGGHYYTPQRAAQLTQEISYSEAGITSRELKELWNMPVIFLLLLLLRSTEWLLRRRWGVI